MPTYEYERRGDVRRLMHYDPAQPEKFVTETQQRVDNIIGTNRELAETQDPLARHTLLARVPVSVYERSILEKWGDDDWKKFLNDPDNKHLRVWPGRV